MCMSKCNLRRYCSIGGLSNYLLSSTNTITHSNSAMNFAYSIYILNLVSFNCFPIKCSVNIHWLLSATTFRVYQFDGILRQHHNVTGVFLAMYPVSFISPTSIIEQSRVTRNNMYLIQVHNVACIMLCLNIVFMNTRKREHFKFLNFGVVERMENISPFQYFSW